MKQREYLGLVYGLVSGLAFATFAWGVDALFLALANATHYGSKIIPGLLICTIATGIAGWLTMRFENHLIAFLLWALVSLLFSWLVVWLPFTAPPDIITILDPKLATWFDFSEVSKIGQFRLVSLVVCGFAAIINGLLEINLIKQALFSPYRAVSVMTMLVCVLLLGVAGTATDHMINTNLREPIQAVDELIKFAADNLGQDVPLLEARKMHLSATKDLGDVLKMPRQLTLISYDPPLGLMNILVNFNGTLVKCTAIHAQPSDCVFVYQKP